MLIIKIYLNRTEPCIYPLRLSLLKPPPPPPVLMDVLHGDSKNPCSMHMHVVYLALQAILSKLFFLKPAHFAYQNYMYIDIYD